MFKIFIVKIKNMYSNIKNLIQTIRVWQWVKNLIVFTMPIGLGTLDLTILLDVFISFFGISLISSSNYIINDIIDIDIDKSHPIKRNRPIANGSITLRTAKLFFLILSLSALSPLIQYKAKVFEESLIISIDCKIL